MRHANLSIFVPHVGCPHLCSFCNQRSISGSYGLPSAQTVEALGQQSAAQLRASGVPAEIAFFGGSFTAIGRDYMLELLRAAQPFVQQGIVSGIRISTRPDYIDPEVLALLAQYRVTAIELGAQSMSDAVLAANGRGHTAQDVQRAARLVQDGGFELGLQMMTGLFRADAQSDLETAHQLVQLHPDTVRIYPTVVMTDTLLADYYRFGVYRPQPLCQAVEDCARLIELFEQAGIQVIRVGLHAQESLSEGMLAGPYHPAFRELCEGAIWAKLLQKAFYGKPQGRYQVSVAPRALSKITGHGAQPIENLRRMGYTIKIKQDCRLKGRSFRIGEM